MFAVGWGVLNVPYAQSDIAMLVMFLQHNYVAPGPSLQRPLTLFYDLLPVQTLSLFGQSQ